MSPPPSKMLRQKVKSNHWDDSSCWAQALLPWHEAFHHGASTGPFTLAWSLSPWCKPFHLGASLSPFCLGASHFTQVQALLFGCKLFCLGASRFAWVQTLLPKCKPFCLGVRTLRGLVFASYFLIWIFKWIKLLWVGFECPIAQSKGLVPRCNGTYGVFAPTSMNILMN